ncbi:MAG: PQQ-binding-like beta-propeller repeat protein [candidate division KSB1 bacterium]|nr:PQQ-binding-like beta-propeller repeat protein [candidate division KSB1 bacterium]
MNSNVTVDTLYVRKDDALWGWPESGAHPFKHLDTVRYFYRLKPGAVNLRVLIDGAAASDSGRIIMDHSRTLSASCENKVIWKLPLEKHVYYCCPAVADDGTIYVTTGLRPEHSPTGSLYAVRPNGEILWRYDFPDIPYSPVIGNDGVIYVQDWHFVLYTISPDGRLLWKFNQFVTQPIYYDQGQRMPAVAADGTIYLPADGLYALEPTTGRLKWRFYPFGEWQPSQTCRQSPVIGADGTIYITIHQDDFFAVNPDGSLKWHAKFDFPEEQTFGCPAIADEGTLYIGTERHLNGFVYAFAPDGSRKWKFEIEGSGRVVRASPTIAADGTVYIATKAGLGIPAIVIALSPSGAKLWEFVVESSGGRLPDDVYCTPTVGADGCIYFGAETQRFYVLKPDGSLNWSTGVEFGLNWSSGALIADGTLYIGTHHENPPNRGNLYALRTSSRGYAPSPWPRFRKNNRNIGRF